MSKPSLFRSQIRFFLVLCFAVSLLPAFFCIWLGSFLGRDFSYAWGECLSLIPGTFGIWLRRSFYYYLLRDCSCDIGIGFGTLFSKRNVKIESDVSIGGYCMIGMCEIGKGTLLGSNIDILSGRHQHGSGDSLGHQKSETNTFTTVKIGKNCWIGNGAIIMNDIGDNCIIGAGSVVVKPIPPNSIAVGNPAIVKKSIILPTVS